MALGKTVFQSLKALFNAALIFVWALVGERPDFSLS